MKTSDYNAGFRPERMNGNGRGTQMTGARSDVGGSEAIPSMNSPVEGDRFNEHRSEEGIRESLHEPEFDMSPIGGNGFGEHDPRHEGHRQTSVHNAGVFKGGDGERDFNDPLYEEASGEAGPGGNPYRKAKGADSPFDPDHDV